MSAFRHPSLATSSVRTRREATSAPALADTSCRKMEGAAKVSHTHTHTPNSRTGKQELGWWEEFPEEKMKSELTLDLISRSWTSALCQNLCSLSHDTPFGLACPSACSNTHVSLFVVLRVYLCLSGLFTRPEQCARCSFLSFLVFHQSESNAVHLWVSDCTRTGISVRVQTAGQVFASRRFRNLKRLLYFSEHISSNAS